MHPRQESVGAAPTDKTEDYRLLSSLTPLHDAPSEMLIRPSADADLAPLTRLYAWHVLHGTGTFELEPPDEPEMARRRADVIGKGLPWLVAEDAGRVVGYAYANHFRPRRAYRFCVEDSIYLSPDATGRGLGRLLLAELVSRCEAAGARQMLALIGDSANHGSIGVHRALGFRQVGLLAASGWKFERWLDVVIMQRELGPGAATMPADPHAD
jgi:L-amino acid N-acyltransferase YncA